MATTTENDSVRDLFRLFDEKDLALVLDACIKHQANATALILSDDAWKGPFQASKFQEKLNGFMLLVPQKIAALAEAQRKLCQLSLGEGLPEFFLQTKEGQELVAAWNALLDGNIAYLGQLCSYAPKDLSNSSYVAADPLFHKLVEQAGVTLLSDGSGGGAFQGKYHGRYIFMIGDKGLYVDYTHEFDKTDNDRKKWTDTHTYTSKVVTGTISENPYRHIKELKPTAEANTDEAAVKEMALAVATKVREYYEKKLAPSAS
ncbi:MAG: hypothetical protein K2W82_14220 [Candidatus Obscuribacterales bacterium]|nr:hypothetical protein [Candidatus Obscuribacterales bacterium]